MVRILWALGFGLWALGFGLWALGFGLWALGFIVFIGFGLCFFGDYSMELPVFMVFLKMTIAGIK